MSDPVLTSATGFLGCRLIASGSLAEVAPALRAELDRQPDADCLTFDDATGHVLDLDLRGTVEEVRARFADGQVPVPAKPSQPARRAPGRPKLGVVGKEVTLLPRHWEWLSVQPGGASVTIRRLIDQARKTGAGAEQRRRSQETAYRFIQAMAGNNPGFEEATRALFAGERDQFIAHLSEWPSDVAAHALRLAAASFEPQADHR